MKMEGRREDNVNFGRIEKELGEYCAVKSGFGQYGWMDFGWEEAIKFYS
jgi:hypothetical protein